MTVERLFGHTRAGESVYAVDLEGGGLRASLISWGAVLRDLRLDGHAPPLVLGYDALSDYEDHSPYFGATVGRYANRIADGAIRLDGVVHQLDRNQQGRHHLHGGAQGLGRRVWRIAELQSDRVRFEIEDPEGHMGYPGRCLLSCTYALGSDGVLSIVQEAQTDRPTPCGLAHHSYFNLDGGPDILDHDLMIDADHYLPVDAEQIPTGEIAEVENTPFDFRQLRPIRMGAGGEQVLYDHNFCLASKRHDKQPAARLTSQKSGVSMAIMTTEPGLQFYCGFKVNTPVAGLQEQPYRPFSGLCLETQQWPDSPNHAAFPDAILKPGEKLIQATDYEFSRV